MANANIKTPTNTKDMTPVGDLLPKIKKPAPGVLDCLQSKSFAKQLEMALPKFFDTDRFVRSAISDFRLNTALQECSVPSVLGFYMQAAMCGLEPSSVLGQCYPVPFNNKKTGQKECQFLIGYRGMASIARRSGDVLSINAQIVHEKDDFEITYGLEQNIVHRPYIDGDPGVMTGAYCVVKFRDGSYQFHYMRKDEIDSHRRRSKSGNFGPWVTDYEEMAKKTVFRAVFKWLPISIEETINAARADERSVKYNMERVDTVPDDDETIEVNFVVATPVDEEVMSDVQPVS